jgi:glutamate racemase
LRSASHAVSPIGVFDSGVGGLSVLRALRAQLPQEDFVYLSDAAHAPYGERTDDYVSARALRVADYLITQHGVKALVVACNTATAAGIQMLRARWPTLPIVGIEPALKPTAAASQTKRVGVMATRSTLQSAKFKTLLDNLQGQAEFVLQACDGLAAAIENGDDTTTRTLCATYVRAMGDFGQQPGQMDSWYWAAPTTPWSAMCCKAWSALGWTCWTPAPPSACKPGGCWTRPTCCARNAGRGRPGCSPRGRPKHCAAAHCVSWI